MSTGLRAKKETQPKLDRFLREVQYRMSKVEDVEIPELSSFGNMHSVPRYIGEFWTSRQRQASSLHEVSYRACFKPHLPRFFIELLTKENETIYDPFSGRGTTILEAALLNRKIISNDVNPLSTILTKPRLFPPTIKEIEKRLQEIPINEKAEADIDLSMFFHPKTEAEIVSLREYLIERNEKGNEDYVDSWIRMVATNRLTGHSKGFFSIYTLPPNQAISPERQKKINEKLNQKPEYRNTYKIILKKSESLLKDITEKERELLKNIGATAIFLEEDARETKDIPVNSVNLTITSPPFLNVVDYVQDNWLRCWFNNIDAKTIANRITMASSLDEWSAVMLGVFRELYRITKPRGFLAFEVGEVKNKKIFLDEHVVPLGVKAGFTCICIVVNKQKFTKTAKIWGIDNNEKGTNTNRIVLFRKG